MPGNQHFSRKSKLLYSLNRARDLLRDGDLASAQDYLSAWRMQYALAPASSRRRWKCGR